MSAFKIADVSLMNAEVGNHDFLRKILRLFAGFTDAGGDGLAVEHEGFILSVDEHIVGPVLGKRHSLLSMTGDTSVGMGTHSERYRFSLGGLSRAKRFSP